MFRKLILTAVLTAVALAAGSAASAGEVVVKNDSPERILVVMAYRIPPTAGGGFGGNFSSMWVVKGWYAVQPGKNAKFDTGNANEFGIHVQRDNGDTVQFSKAATREYPVPSCKFEYQFTPDGRNAVIEQGVVSHFDMRSLRP